LTNPIEGWARLYLPTNAAENISEFTGQNAWLFSRVENPRSCLAVC
jgi:hypothetical protein